jgi:hypothetical protein
MTGMVRRWLAVAVFVLLVAGEGGAEIGRSLKHRVWILDGLPDDATLTALRAAGVEGLVLPVGRVELADGASRFTLSPLPDLKGLVGWSVTALVWVEGSGKASGDPDTFAAQLAPVQRSLPGGAGLVLATKGYSAGVVGLAVGAAKRLHQTVELALPAVELARHAPRGGWEGVHAVAVAFGNPPALAFPASTLQDDLMALDGLDGARVPYRVAIVVAPRATPPPGPAGASLADIVGGETSVFEPGERGDVFQLRRAVSWGGVSVEANRTIVVELVDTARYNRDLGLLLRPVRPRLEGWDTVGLPAPEPTLGMSREAFLDYLQGGSPYPRPEVEVEFPGPTVMRVSLANPTPQASALARTGNWTELRFEGTEVRDVQLGDFSGMEYGRPERGVWHPTVARDATALRFYLTYLAPRARVTGCVVTFLSRPHAVSAGWGVRVGDGSAVTGPLEPVRLTTR